MAKKVDYNGFWKIDGNPLSKVGVFPYLGKQISDKLEPNKIYMVYRPAEELFSKDAIDSFNKNPVPLIENHEMIGKGFTPAEKKGVEGVINNIRRDGDKLVGDISIYSDHLKDKIANGKKDLSMGYFCNYELADGDFQGHHYDAIQRDIRSNHVALVDRGRMGSDVRVYDSFTFDCAIESMYAEDDYVGEAARVAGKALWQSVETTFFFAPTSILGSICKKIAGPLFVIGQNKFAKSLMRLGASIILARTVFNSKTAARIAEMAVKIARSKGVKNSTISSLKKSLKAQKTGRVLKLGKGLGESIAENLKNITDKLKSSKNLIKPIAKNKSIKKFNKWMKKSFGEGWKSLKELFSGDSTLVRGYFSPARRLQYLTSYRTKLRVRIQSERWILKSKTTTNAQKLQAKTRLKEAMESLKKCQKEIKETFAKGTEPVVEKHFWSETNPRAQKIKEEIQKLNIKQKLKAFGKYSIKKSWEALKYSSREAGKKVGKAIGQGAGYALGGGAVYLIARRLLDSVNGESAASFFKNMDTKTLLLISMVGGYAGSDIIMAAAKKILSRKAYRRLTDATRESRRERNIAGLTGALMPAIGRVYSEEAKKKSISETLKDSAVAGGAMFTTASLVLPFIKTATMVHRKTRNTMKKIRKEYRIAKETYKQVTNSSPKPKAIEHHGEPDAWITYHGKHIPIYNDDGPKKVGDSACDGDSDIKWITVNGQHIPIKKGQSVKKGIKEFFANKTKASSKNISKSKLSHKSLYEHSSHTIYPVQIPKAFHQKYLTDLKVSIPNHPDFKKPGEKIGDKHALMVLKEISKKDMGKVNTMYKALKSDNARNRYGLHAYKLGLYVALGAIVRRTLSNKNNTLNHKQFWNAVSLRDSISHYIGKEITEMKKIHNRSVKRS